MSDKLNELHCDPASTSPRVDELIAGVMKRFPGVSASAQARYYEEVHQHLAPLARELEAENARLHANAVAIWKNRAASPAPAIPAVDAAAIIEQCAIRAAIHSQYPVETDFDRGYDKARKDAAHSIRAIKAAPAIPADLRGLLVECRENLDRLGHGGIRDRLTAQIDAIDAAPAISESDAVERSIEAHLKRIEAKTGNLLFDAGTYEACKRIREVLDAARKGGKS